MSSIQPSSGAPMPPGAAVGPVASDPAVQAQIDEVNAQLQAVNAQLGGSQPTGYAPAAEPAYIGMEGTALVDSLSRRAGDIASAAAPIGLGPVAGGGPTSDAPKLSDLIEQARVRRDIDEQMAQLGPVTGGGSTEIQTATGEHLGGTQPGDSDKFADQMLQQAAAASGVPSDQIDELREMAGTDPAGPGGGGALGVQAEPYIGGASTQTGLYTGGASTQLAGATPGAALSEEQQLEQLLSQLTPAELAQLEAEMQGGAGAASSGGSGATGAVGTAPAGTTRT